MRLSSLLGKILDCSRVECAYHGIQSFEVFDHNFFFFFLSIQTQDRVCAIFVSPAISKVSPLSLRQVAAYAEERKLHAIQFQAHRGLQSYAERPLWIKVSPPFSHVVPPIRQVSCRQAARNTRCTMRNIIRSSSYPLKPRRS